MRSVSFASNLPAEASDRLHRFDHFMTDTTERDAARAESLVARRRSSFETLIVKPPQFSESIPQIEADSPALSQRLMERLSATESVRVAAVQWLSGQGSRPTVLTDDPLASDLQERATALRTTATSLDISAYRGALLTAQAALREIEATLVLAKAEDGVRREVQRLRQLQVLQAAVDQAGTTAITAKSSQLTRLYASEVLKDQFTRETEQLQLRRVTMRDLGGRKGQLEQQPSLLGAKATDVSTMQVLSEGEQTALGLAGFFTEATFDKSRSALILDDPVTSLDHVRREHVAKRLAELAADRQVVVFTHGVAFVGELQKQATRQGVSLTPRAVERQGAVPGHVVKSLPWKAKDFRARYSELETRLGTLTKDRGQLTQDDWEERVASWAGKLSELWERAVSSEVLDEVYDRGTAEVRVLKFRILAAITEADNDDFQAGYGACSKWARRHDKAPETNYVAPEPDALKAELDRINAWQARVKSYRRRLAEPTLPRPTTSTRVGAEASLLRHQASGRSCGEPRPRHRPAPRPAP